LEKNNLPHGWIQTSLKTILSILENGSRPRGGVQKISKGIPSIGGEHLTYDGKFNFNKLKFVPKSFYDLMIKGKIKLNDVLIVKDGATTGKTSFVGNNFPYEQSAINEHVFLLRGIPEVILQKFLFYFVISSDGQEHINKKSTGLIGGINTSFVDDFKILLPPLNEQKQILFEIEKYFSFADYVLESLNQNKQKIAHYYASFLSDVFLGKSTKSFRVNSDESYPISSEFEKIKINFDEKFNEYKKQGFQNIIPDSWIWSNLGKLKEFSLYGPRYSSKDYVKSGYSVLRTSDINKSGKVNFKNSPKLQLSDLEFQKYCCNVDDILFTRTGSLGTLAVFNDNVKSIPSAYLIQYRLKKIVKNSSWYIFYFFKSPLGQKSLIRRGAGIGRPNLNAPNIESILIPFAPLSEQKEIVEIIRATETIVDNLNISIDNISTSVNILKKSVLKYAFEGKLVPQDPNDEPASELLKRIKNF
jgi:type I restriction enzyme, S subunit